MPDVLVVTRVGSKHYYYLWQSEHLVLIALYQLNWWLHVLHQLFISNVDNL